MCDKCNSRIHDGASKYGRREFKKARAAPPAATPPVRVTANVDTVKEDAKDSEGPHATGGSNDVFDRRDLLRHLPVS